MRNQVYPGNPAITWDGVALVNTGVGSTPVTVYQKTYDGAVVDQRVIADQLESGEKLLFLFFDQFAHQPDTYFDVEAGSPLALIALRGNLHSDFLWENKALPLPG